MSRHVGLIIGLTLLAAAPLHAQHPSTHKPAIVKQASAATPTDLKARWEGTWDGTYQSDHAPDGTIRLALSQDSTWKGTLTVFIPDNTMSAVVSDLRFDGDKVTWSQVLMGQPCTSSAVLDAGALKGETQCGHGGLMFVMKRK